MSFHFDSWLESRFKYLIVGIVSSIAQLGCGKTKENKVIADYNIVEGKKQEEKQN